MREKVTPENIKPSYQAPVVLVGWRGGYIERLEIEAGKTPDADFLCLVLDDSAGLTINQLVLRGLGEEIDWPSGLLAFAERVTVNRIQGQNLHIGARLEGASSAVLSGTLENVTGDFIQLCADDTTACANCAGSLDVVPEYHRDVVQLFSRNGGELQGVKIDGVTYRPNDHPLCRPPQGILASECSLSGAMIKNCVLEGVHESHGISLLVPTKNSTVIDNKTNGMIRLPRKTNTAINNTATVLFIEPIESKRTIEKIEVNEVKKIFDPIAEFRLEGDPAKLPVGILLNNPGCIKRYEGNNWANRSTDPQEWHGYQLSRRRDLERFEHPVAGMRAVCIIMQNKQRRGLDTIAKLINDYAPWSGEGADNSKASTDAYIKHVSASVGVGVNERVSVRDYRVMRGMLIAIMEHENGYLVPYPDSWIDQALKEAGIPMEGENLLTEPKKTDGSTKAGATVAGTGALASAISTIVAISANISQEEAESLINASGQVVEAVKSTGMGWLEWLVIVNSISLLAMGVGAFLIYRATNKNRALY